MPNLREIFTGLLPDCAEKIVTPTDKNKSAYVLTMEQVTVLDHAGIDPARNHTFEVHVIGDSDRTSVSASYYRAIRQGARREPEPRMGREFISAWLRVGDGVILGTDGVSLFACRIVGGRNLSPTEQEAVESQVCRRLSDGDLLRRAEQAPARIPCRKVLRTEYVRSGAVVEFAKRRSQGRCEMPGCAYEPFNDRLGESYREVHHITSLADGGVDSLENVVALCANCHRAMHHSADRLLRTRCLQEALAQARRSR